MSEREDTDANVVRMAIYREDQDALDAFERIQAHVEALEGALREAEACDIARRAGDQSYEDDRIERIARAALAEGGER